MTTRIPIRADVTPPPRRDVVTWLAVFGLGGAAALTARLLAAPRSNSAERLMDALLNTELLCSPAADAQPSPETVAAGCVAYFLAVTQASVRDMGMRGSVDDTVGESRTRMHRFTRASAMVLTETTRPSTGLTFALDAPDIGHVKGARRIEELRMVGIATTRNVRDRAQIRLGRDYTAQLETDFEVSNHVLTRGNRVTGTLTMRDSHDDVARVSVAGCGTISGSLTRGDQMVGRFAGNLTDGARFIAYLTGTDRD